MLDAAAVESLSRAARNHFWFELFLDDLPIWGFVGPPPPPQEPEEADDRSEGASPPPPLHVYTHRAFDVSYNGEVVGETSFFSFVSKSREV